MAITGRSPADLPPADRAAGACVVVFAALAISFWLLQIVAARRSTRRWRRTTTSARSRCARRAACCYDRNGQVLVENRHSFTSRSCASTPRISIARSACSPRSRVSTQRRPRRSSPGIAREPTLPADRGRRGCVAGAGSGDHGAASRFRAARRRRRGSADAAVSGEVYGGASVRLRRRGQRRAGGGRRLAEERRYGRTGGHREDLQPAADGTGRRARSSSSTASAARSARSTKSRRPKASACSSRSTTTCRRRRKTGSRRARCASDQRGRGGRARSAHRRSAGVRERAGVRPERVRGGIDRATWASLNSDEQRPLNDRAMQGRYSPGSTFKMAVALAGLEEGVITPDFKVNCSGGANFYGHYFKCWRKGGHGAIDLRHAIEQSCDVYFYTVAQHASASTRSTSGRRCSASA